MNIPVLCTGAPSQAQHASLLHLKQLAKTISPQDFEASVSIQSWLDPDESIEDALACDPEILFWRVHHNSKEYFGVSSMGVEMLFSADGSIPVMEGPDDAPETGISALAWVLEKEGAPLSFSHAGNERLEWETSKARKLIGFPGQARYQLLEEGRVIAGAFVVNNNVSAIYTRLAHRRTGRGKALLKMIMRDFPGLDPSTSLTEDGRKFQEGVGFERLKRQCQRSKEAEPSV